MTARHFDDEDSFPLEDAIEARDGRDLPQSTWQSELFKTLYCPERRGLPLAGEGAFRGAVQ
jgi:hypothetical protein